MCRTKRSRDKDTGLLKSHLAQLRLAACDGQRGREGASRAGRGPRATLFLSFGVGWGRQVVTFEKPWTRTVDRCIFVQGTRVVGRDAGFIASRTGACIE